MSENVKNIKESTMDWLAGDKLSIRFWFNVFMVIAVINLAGGLDINLLSIFTGSEVPAGE